MANSQNGWPAITSSGDARLAVFPWVTGRVLAGDVSTVFGYLARRFHYEVEPIDVASSWGWAYRPISGSDDLSNHSSGTAIDLNAPRHPLGASGTFSPAQVAVINAIVAALSPAVRWGGDYTGRKDEMHFEINTSPAVVAQVAARISGSTTPNPPEDDMPLNDADKQFITNETHRVVLAILRADEFKLNAIPEQVLAARVDTTTGTFAQTLRDARQISRRHEQAWRAFEGLPADPNA
jgi:hypothetical protein